MSITPVKTPKWLKRIAPHITWHLPAEAKDIYLTFDDGPTPEVTDWTLDQLKKFDAKATFFCVGSQAEKYPSILNRIKTEGHSIGNHTQNHIKGWSATTSKYMNDIDEASKYIKSKLFRPPYGQIRPRQIEALKNEGYKIIMWSVLSKDWDQNLSEVDCAKNVKDNIKQGDIIVFHDSLKAKRNMMYALPLVLEDLKNRGFKFKRIPEPTL